jgi:hypothetical protein
MSGDCNELINSLKTIETKHFYENEVIGKLIELITDKRLFINKFMRKFPDVKNIFIEYYSYINKLEFEHDIIHCLKLHYQKLMTNLIWYYLIDKELYDTKISLQNAQQSFPKNKLIKNNEDLIVISHQYEKFKKDIVNIEILENKYLRTKSELKSVLLDLFIFV